MLASEVMDRAAALMNDPLKTTYTHEVQLPYLLVALDEMEEELSVRGQQITKEVSQAMIVLQGTKEIAPPVDLITPTFLSERRIGEGDDRWVPMNERSWEPKMAPSNRMIYWTFRENMFQFPGASNDVEILVRYTKKLASVNGPASEIPFLGSKSFLSYRTASLLAQFISKNMIVAEELGAMALSRSGTFITANVRSQQNNRIRRQRYGSTTRGRLVR